MNTVAKIACRTIGTLGMGVALYDACRVANHRSKVMGEETQAKNLERIYSDTRDITHFSYVEKDIAEKSFDMRSKNPMYNIYGKTKGAIIGFLEGLGNYLPAIACSAFALLGKGTGAAIGAAGVGICSLIRIAREGFGLGKTNPMQ